METPVFPTAAPQPPALPNKDASHLKTLAICHYVIAGLSVLGLGFLALHYMIMRTVFMNPDIWKDQGQKAQEMPFKPEEFFGYFQWFYIIAGIFIVVGGILTLMSGRFISQRKKRVFSIVVAGLNCLHFPFGMALGIFTLVVITRDSVKRLYSEAQAKIGN